MHRESSFGAQDSVGGPKRQRAKLRRSYVVWLVRRAEPSTRCYSLMLFIPVTVIYPGK